MTATEEREQMRAGDAPPRKPGKGGYGAGGVFPPAAPRRSRLGGSGWFWLALAALFLLTVAGATHLFVGEPEQRPAHWRKATIAEDPAAAQMAAPVGDIADVAGRSVIALPNPVAAHGLEFEELLTGGGDPASALPLIIAVHGLGDRPDRFKKLFLGLPFAARVIVPRGPIEYHGGYSWFPTEIKGGKVVSIDFAAVADSARRLALLADNLATSWPTSGMPVITGFSQGGILSFVVAANHPGSVTGAIPIAGIWPAELRPGAKRIVPAVVALHGKDDTLVPYAKAEDSVRALGELGVDARLEGFPDVGHRVSAEMRLRLFRLLGELLAQPALSYLTSAM